MLFVMDVGNSHTVLGLYEGDELRAHWRIVSSNYRTGDELGLLFSMLLHQHGMSPKDISGCCISSVVPQLNLALTEVSERIFGLHPVMVGPGVKTGLVIQVDNPREVGADRIVNAVAALEQHPGPLVVIDFGTATTFDVISGRGEYKGGVIFPGIQLSATALFEHCARLPQVEVTPPPTVIGKDTVTHIRSGLTYGYADLVDGLIARIAAEMGEAPYVIATGGLAPVVANLAKRIDLVDNLLTLKGLKSIYRKNEKSV